MARWWSGGVGEVVSTVVQCGLCLFRQQMWVSPGAVCLFRQRGRSWHERHERETARARARREDDVRQSQLGYLVRRVCLGTICDFDLIFRRVAQKHPAIL